MELLLDLLLLAAQPGQLQTLHQVWARRSVLLAWYIIACHLQLIV